MRAATRSLVVALVAIASVAHAQPTQQVPRFDVGGGDRTAARRGDLLGRLRGRTITTADIKAWNSIRTATLSNDGKWFAYVVAPAEGDATLVLESTTDASKETKFPVGGTGGGTFTISGDSKWIGFIVAPPRPPNAATGGGRGGRGGGGANGAGAGGAGAAAPRNKFVLVNIATGEKKEFDRIRTFLFNAESPTWVALQGYGAGAPAVDAAPGGGRGGQAPVIPGSFTVLMIGKP